MTQPLFPPRSVDPRAVAAVEALRASYRPHRIMTLFVGESAPVCWVTEARDLSLSRPPFG